LQNVTLNGQCISGDTECNLEIIGHILKKMHELCHFSLDTYKNSSESFFHPNYLCLPLKGILTLKCAMRGGRICIGKSISI